MATAVAARGVSRVDRWWRVVCQTRRDAVVVFLNFEETVKKAHRADLRAACLYAAAKARTTGPTLMTRMRAMMRAAMSRASERTRSKMQCQQFLCRHKKQRTHTMAANAHLASLTVDSLHHIGCVCGVRLSRAHPAQIQHRRAAREHVWRRACGPHGRVVGPYRPSR